VSLATVFWPCFLALFFGPCFFFLFFLFFAFFSPAVAECRCPHQARSIVALAPTSSLTARAGKTMVGAAHQETHAGRVDARIGASLTSRDASPTRRDASTRRHDASLMRRDASTRRRDASLMRRDASTRRHDASLMRRDASTRRHDASLMRRDASPMPAAASLVIQWPIRQERLPARIKLCAFSAGPVAAARTRHETC
jgi:hypothetical protein